MIKIMKIVSPYRLAVLLILFTHYHSTEASEVFSVRTVLRSTEAFGVDYDEDDQESYVINKKYGIKVRSGGLYKGGKVELRLMEKSTNDVLFYGFVQARDQFAEDRQSHIPESGLWCYAEKPPGYIWGYYDAPNYHSTYKNKITRHTIYIDDNGSINSPLKNLAVKVELTLTGDILLSDILEIKLPGVETLYPEDFAPFIKIRGTNFTVRPAASNAYLDAQGIPYSDAYSTNLEITENLLQGDSNLEYKIAVPRIIRPEVMSGLPSAFKNRETGSFATNLVLYPRDKSFWVVSLDGGDPLRSMQSKGNGTLSKESSDLLFTATLDGTPYDYRMYEITSTTHDPVIFKKVDQDGPFPLIQGGILIKRPESNPLNRKMLNKESLNENEKFLVSWHRGFWRDVPENTLQSIDAAKAFLSTSDMLELDVSRAKDLSEYGMHNYVLFHDPFMFRESSIGPNRSGEQCVDPYDRLLVKSDLLATAKRGVLKDTLMRRFPGYTSTEYDNWIKGPGDFTQAELTQAKVRDRFGCLTDITIPTLTEAIETAKSNDLPIMVDKGWDDIDGIYWHAILNGFEDNVYFKGGDNRQAEKLTKMYGNELFQQIAYTPFYFDNRAQNTDAVENGNVKFFQKFLDKERDEGWVVPGFELQIKLRVDDGSSIADGFSPDGIQRLLDFNTQYKATKWMGITQINPTAYNGFDNKIVFMDAGPKPKEANIYSSRFDRRADLIFNMNYLKCDYWTTDRPDVVVNFLKAIGKIPN